MTLKPIITALDQDDYDQLMILAKKQFEQGIIPKNTPYAIAKKAILEYAQNHQ